MTAIEFRDVHDGDRIPGQCYHGDGRVDDAKVLMWFCLSLTEAEARALVRIAERRAPLYERSVAGMRRLIERNLPRVREELEWRADNGIEPPPWAA